MRLPAGIERSAEVRALVDHVVDDVLTSERAHLTALHPASAALVDEIRRLHEAGGHRMRPVFVVWGYRAAGGVGEEAVVRAAAAVELLHLMALIHDDLMDATAERRGVAASHVHLAGGSPARGRSLAVLVGDLAAVLADRLLLTSGFDPERVVAALAPYHEMRVAMAAGQYLDVAGVAADPALIAGLKGGSYSVEGPLVVGATLAGGDDAVVAALRAYARPLGLAFQVRDDLVDRDPAAGDDDDVAVLVATALAALEDARMPEEPRAALADLARTVTAP